MRAMRLAAPGSGRLVPSDEPVPEPAVGQLRVRVRACGVCRTDLHVVDGELPGVAPRIVPGHEIVGTVDAVGPGVDVALGTRVGVPWLGWTCGHCRYCLGGRENLCGEARYTGAQLDGGYAEYAVADARFCTPLPDGYDDLQVAPLLCAGLIGHRTYRMAGPDARVLGIYGFGAAAHIVTQVAVWEGRTVFAFTRPGDAAAQAFARDVGAAWAGGSDETPPEPLDAALLFAPDGALVPTALRHTVRGGVVVCGGIHMSDLPSFPYALLWGERVVRSVANLTRADARDLLAIAPRVPVRTHVHPYRLDDATRALDDLRAGRFTGAAVVVP